MGVQSSVAYNSVADNGDNNSVCCLGSQECGGQMIRHHHDGLAKQNKSTKGGSGEARGEAVSLRKL